MWQEFLYSGTGGSRPYFVYTPGAYTVRANVPLLIMLHGCQQTALDFANGTRMNALADQYNFIVAYPQQTSSANIGGCWNWYQRANQQRGQGEPAIIAGIVAAIQQNTAQWTIDASRVYVAGLSSGGSLAAILGATYPDVFAAIGVHSGVEYGAATNQFNALQVMRRGGPDPVRQGQAAFAAMGAAARVVPTIVFHGANDIVVAPTNGDEVVQQWMETDRLASNGTYTASFDQPVSVMTGQIPDGYAYTLSTWIDHTGTITQVYCKVSGLGHAWSGGDPAGSYSDPRGPDASASMYTFFAQHPKPVSRVQEVPLHVPGMSLWGRVRQQVGRVLHRNAKN